MIKKIFGFLRVWIALSITFIAISGYLIFNKLGGDIILVILASFFLSCGAYGFNSITDKEEDCVNRQENPLASSGLGAAIVLLCFSIGLALSLIAGTVSLLISLSIITSAVVYSHFRLKRYILVKNFYTAFAVSQAFILGAAAFSHEVLWYYLSISLFLFIGSIVSDLRDYEGDKGTGIETIPVRFGRHDTKRLVYFLLALIFLVFLKTNFYLLLPLSVSVPIIYILVSRDRPHHSHVCGNLSIIFLAVWLAFLGI